MADLSGLGEKLAAVREEVQKKLNELQNSTAVYELKKTIMDAKSGEIGSLMREMGKIPGEQRAEYGKRVNELKRWAEERFQEMNDRFREAEMKRKYESEKIDVTIPAKAKEPGNLHPTCLYRLLRTGSAAPGY